jgi:AcrR family transcriptional regulator
MTRLAKSQNSLSPVQERIQKAALRLFAEKGVDGVNVKDLARKAKVARGTIYNNHRASIESMFQKIATQLSVEMHHRVAATRSDIDDPALRLSIGIRLFVRRAHEEPDWGNFIQRFTMNNSAMRQMWLGPPRKDLARGIARGRYNLDRELLPAAIVMIATTALGAIFLVVKGRRHWRKAGSDAAELMLRALGISPAEAHNIATAELPKLAPLP